MTTQCCKCRKIKTAAGWDARGEPEKGSAVSHGYCEPCLDDALAGIEKEAGV